VLAQVGFKREVQHMLTLYGPQIQLTPHKHGDRERGMRIREYYKFI